MDDRSGPDELALYCLSRKHGVHTAVFNKSYVWTTLSEHIQCSDEEIMSLCGINLVFLDHTTYGIIKNIRVPNPRTDAIDNVPPTPAQNQKKQHGKTTCHDNSRGRHPRKRNEDKNNTTCGSKHMTLSKSRHATFGITAPSTRSVRSSRQPIDYLTLNDGLDENTLISPKRRKKNTNRPRSGSSATRQAVGQHQTVSQESHTTKALPAVPLMPAAPSNTERVELSGVPDEQGLPNLVIDHDNNPKYPTTTQEAEAASTEEELEVANTLLSLVEAQDDTLEDDNENIMLMPIGGANAPIDVAPEPLQLNQANVDHAIAKLTQTQEQNKDNPSEKTEQSSNADQNVKSLPEAKPVVKGALKTKTYALKKKADGKPHSFKCSECKIMTGSIKELNAHHTECHNPQLCSVCGRSFQLSSSLTRHMYVHMETRYKCNQCDYTCHFESEMRSHRVVHRMNPSHQCMVYAKMEPHSTSAKTRQQATCMRLRRL